MSTRIQDWERAFTALKMKLDSLYKESLDVVKLNGSTTILSQKLSKLTVETNELDNVLSSFETSQF